MEQEGHNGKLHLGMVIASRYKVLRFITRGGMGELYEVEDERTKRNLALKIVPKDIFVDDPEWAQRFKNECEAIGKVNSEYIVRVLDNGVFEKTAFIVTELVDGEDLESIIRENANGVPQADVVNYLEQVARGLQKLHDAGIVHRDLKPANLMLTKRDDGSPWIRIIDFGIVKVQRPGLPPEPTMGELGTLGYMAPEARRNGAVTHLADIYALGVIAFKLLKGRHFNTADDDSPGPFLDWYRRTTAEKPVDRFESATMAIAELSAALNGTIPKQINAARPVIGPDLNGTWQGEIISNWEDPGSKRKLDPIAVFMVIKQTGNDLQMRLLTSESSSSSMVSTIKPEADGRWSIHGTYLNEPKLLLCERSPIHHGGIMLHIGGPPPTTLAGQYWTDRNTKGEMTLRLISRATADDYVTAKALAR